MATDAVMGRVTPDELRQELDRLARERLGMPADEFLERLKSGELDLESPTVSRLAILARLLTVPA